MIALTWRIRPAKNYDLSYLIEHTLAQNFCTL
jgi:hypothetical protein